MISIVQKIDSTAAHDIEIVLDRVGWREFPIAAQVAYLQRLGQEIEPFLRQGVEGGTPGQEVTDLDQFDFHGVKGF